MAKPKRRTPSQKRTGHFLTTRRVWLFIIALILIVLMVWQVLLTLGASTNATYNKRGACAPKNGGKGWGGFTVCDSAKATSCADGCQCVPLREGFRIGRCVANIDLTPTPTVIPTVMPSSRSCGELCDTDADCGSGYCHDPNWQACPTETPEPTVAGMPTNVPQPTKECGIRGSSDPNVTAVKVCRDRECFDGDQCACPVPDITLVPITPTTAPDVTAVPPPVCTPPVCQNGALKKCNKPDGCPGSCGVVCTSRKPQE